MKWALHVYTVQEAMKKQMYLAEVQGECRMMGALNFRQGPQTHGMSQKQSPTTSTTSPKQPPQMVCALCGGKVLTALHEMFCPKCLANCEYCDRKIIREHMEEHKMACFRRPIQTNSCPYCHHILATLESFETHVFSCGGSRDTPPQPQPPQSMIRLRLESNNVESDIGGSQLVPEGSDDVWPQLE
ncbi:hypothetical protein BC936DRAFT_147518, partial [Jimgerdemannia flammicorona]